MFTNHSQKPAMVGLAEEFADKLNRYTEVAFQFIIPMPEGLMSAIETGAWQPTGVKATGNSDIYAIAEGRRMYLVLIPCNHLGRMEYPESPYCFNGNGFFAYQYWGA